MLRAVSYFVAGIVRIMILEASAALLVVSRVVRRDDARGHGQCAAALTFWDDGAARLLHRGGNA